MEIKVHIPFEELVAIVKQLSPEDKAQLKNHLEKETHPNQKSRLTELLLSGPVFTEEQIGVIEENRKSINQWRTEP